MSAASGNEFKKIKGVYEPLNEEIEFKEFWGNHEFNDDELKNY